MKKLFVILMAAMMLLAIFTMTALATDNGEDDRIEAIDSAETVVTINNDEPAPEPTPTTPWTWQYLATIAGATAATLLIVQFLKVPLDQVWKIPTRAFVYIIALVILTTATGFTSGLDPNSALLCILNAFIVALAAYGGYEVTFAKLNK